MDGRVFERLDALYAIGGTSAGTDRTGYAEGEDQAHRLVAGWMEQDGLEVECDLAGNLFGRLLGTDLDDAPIWTGSHVDSVPGGGRLDGALGVVAGLEALQRIGRQRRTLCVAVFRDEEGWRFGRGCFGSRALCGLIEPNELDTRDAGGTSLREAIGNDLPTGGWLASPTPAAYVELHIEQGPVLDELDVPLGIVSAVVGLARLSISFHGHEGHAGTTPMAGRDDALCKAAAFVLATRDVAIDVGGGAVATVGRIDVAPNATNVIPGSTRALVDARAPTEAGLARLLDGLQQAAAAGTIEVLRRTSPVALAPSVQDALRAATASLELEAPDLASGAGHDAGVLAEAGIPTGMLFVRSRNRGVSHSPEEHSDDADIILAVDALARALASLASS